jgi:hypothetical protein
MVVRVPRVRSLPARAQRTVSCFCIGFLFGAAAISAHAQEPAKPDPNPPTTPQPALAQPSVPQTNTPPGAGAGAQVRTGSQFGLQSLASRLQRLLADHQFTEMESLLDTPDDSNGSGASKLAPAQKQLFRGVHPPEEKLLRKTLAEDYLRAGDWAKANQAYLELEYRLGGSMTQDEKDEIELPLKLLPLDLPVSTDDGRAGRTFHSALRPRWAWIDRCSGLRRWPIA